MAERIFAEKQTRNVEKKFAASEMKHDNDNDGVLRIPEIDVGKFGIKLVVKRYQH